MDKVFRRPRRPWPTSPTGPASLSAGSGSLALLAYGATDLTIVSNNCGIDGAGLGLLLAEHRISRAISSYVGENREVARQLLAGEIQLELTPQGTPAERLRAGGAGIPAFYTATGTRRTGAFAMASPPKDIRVFDGREYLLGRVDRSDLCPAGAAVATHNRRHLGADGRAA